MKYIAILFGVYMILLAIMPCRDADDFAIEKYNTAISNDHKADEKAGKETCTPFCTCTCCSITRTVTNYQVYVTVFIHPIANKYGETPVHAIVKQPISIWQPPQIG